MTSAVTTHVLDTSRGQPAQGVEVRLEGPLTPDGAPLVGVATTDADGRVTSLGPEQLEPGTYRLTFVTGDYFADNGQDAFYPEVAVTVVLTDREQHYHLPLLLSPFSYSTYRGS
jgi:5-hydroxyisourate hydrolase